MDSSNCLFCKIVNKEIPKEFVYENEHVVAFLDIHPVNSGHTLIIPKKHSVNILDTEDEILREIAVTVKKISRAIQDGLGYPAFNVEVNNGEVAGQIIPHAHWHVVPRRADDGLKHWKGGSYAEGEDTSVVHKLQEALTSL